MRGAVSRSASTLPLDLVCRAAESRHPREPGERTPALDYGARGEAETTPFSGWFHVDREDRSTTLPLDASHRQTINDQLSVFALDMASDQLLSREYRRLLDAIPSRIEARQSCWKYRHALDGRGAPIGR
jgi:hypothetical protein